MKTLSLVLASVLALAASTAALAADPVGPIIGNNKYRGTISSYDDADDFTAMLLRGDVLTVALTLPKTGGEPLKPLVSLVDPDGISRSAGFVVTKGGAVLLKEFVVDKTGLWAVRVESTAGTTGDYLVSFRLRTAPKLVFRDQRLGDDQPFSRAYEFPGFTGAILDATLVRSQKGLPVEFHNMTDASGAEVMDAAGRPAVASAKVKGRTVTLRGVKLSDGAGAYHLRTSIGTAASQFDLTISLRCPNRPSSGRQRVLPPAEPTLDPAAAEQVAQAGDTVRFTGTHFSTKAPPVVRFGTATASRVTVGGGGTTLDVVVPQRTGPALVSVYVVNPDGQGTGRDRYFAYLPAPAVTDLVDAGGGAAVRTSPAPGGRTVRLVGTAFESTHTIRVGGVTVKSPTFLSPTEFRFVLPAAPDGYQPVTVTDVHGRSGTSAFTVRYKTAPTFAPAAYSPAAAKSNVPTTVTIRGTGFEDVDLVYVNGSPIESAWLGATARTVDLPALPAGGYAFRFVDSIGTVVNGPVYTVKDAPAISGVTVTAGPVIGKDLIPVRGGTTIRVDGANFVADDVVTLGGSVIRNFVTSTETRKEFVAPAGSSGWASLTILDGADQSATAEDVVRYAGFVDETGARLPVATSEDDFSAVRGAAADLDGDGLADDVVLVSPLASPPGSRQTLTRVLFGDDTGAFTDVTSDVVPAAGSDGTGMDGWDATCLAVGDLDGRGAPDILIGGEVAPGGGYRQVRMFTNDGSGRFALDESLAPADRSGSYVYGVYRRYSYYYGYYSYQYGIYGSMQQRGVPTALAVGDLDQDGTLDAVLGTDATQSRPVYLDPAGIDFSTSPPTILSVSWASWQQYLPATRILLNGGGLVDRSTECLPAVGRSTDTTTHPAAFHSRDLAVADVNGDGLLDIVVAWDDPATVSAFGLTTLQQGGASQDVARTATRILLNSPSDPGRFTDVTDKWMPSSSDPEHWQANRIAVADLDGDGDMDLVLVTSRGLDAWTGTETHDNRALRVLRNDGSRFTDVSGSAVPAVDGPTSDDWRGDALTVRDVDGDGCADILVSTKSPLVGPAGSTAQRLRVLYGDASAGLAFRRIPEFQEALQVDTGEADDLLFVGDPAGSDAPVLLFLGVTAPKTSPKGAATRVQEWVR